MANIQTNPWSFTNADVVKATIAAGGLVLNADGTVTLTTTLAHGLVATNFATVINAGVAAYNGFYFVLSVPTTTTAILVPKIAAGIPVGTGASSGGTIALNAYNAMVRVEDISWQNAASQGDTLDLRDRNGNIIWQATATGAGAQNRGKIFWIDGLTPVTITSGVVILTIN
jgi:hypothetical protein